MRKGEEEFVRYESEEERRKVKESKLGKRGRGRELDEREEKNE